MQNNASMKYELRKEAAQRTCTVITPSPKRVQSDAMYIFCFLYILVPYVYLYTQFQNLPGRVNCWISLKFTEKYYKKLSFSIETNPFHVLWFEKFRNLFSRSRTTKRATLLYIQGIIVIACCCVNFIFVRLLNIRIYLLLTS